MQPSPDIDLTLDLEALLDFVLRYPRLFVITGAGCSTGSNIPDYRDEQGDWKRRPPVMYQDFISKPATRQRYWGRSMVGWQYFSRAQPNPGHTALARLETMGRITCLVTQNVDKLHQQAGSREIIPLHGTLDTLTCQQCASVLDREQFQSRLLNINSRYAEISAPRAPDGDADIDHIDFSAVRVPACGHCNGVLKPDVVFYGESVPRDRYRRAEAALAAADAVLVAGSSLMVYSSYRFAKRAAELGKPIAAVNLGRTRADELLVLKVRQPCEQVLPQLVQALMERESAAIQTV